MKRWIIFLMIFALFLVPGMTAAQAQSASPAQVQVKPETAPAPPPKQPQGCTANLCPVNPPPGQQNSGKAGAQDPLKTVQDCPPYPQEPK